MSVGSDLLRFSQRPLLVHDFESNRLNLAADCLPFQCSWIVVRPGQPLQKHSYYLKWPDYDMSPDAARITRFNPAWVTNGDDPEFVLDAWESYALDPQYLIIGQNWLGYDFQLWQLWREALGKERDHSALDRIIDTNLLGRAYKCGWKPDRSSLTAWFYKVYNTPVSGVKTNLLAMAKELGVDVDEGRLHDAEYDLIVTLGVYRKLINLIEL